MSNSFHSLKKLAWRWWTKYLAPNSLHVERCFTVFYSGVCLYFINSYVFTKYTGVFYWQNQPIAYPDSHLLLFPTRVLGHLIHCQFDLDCLQNISLLKRRDSKVICDDCKALVVFLVTLKSLPFFLNWLFQYYGFLRDNGESLAL